MTTLEIHPYCACVPEQSPREYARLRDDIVKQGRAIDPIVLLGGKILNGRHRYQACCETGKPYTTRDYDPAIDGDDPISYVQSQTIHRHLSAGQRAAMALELDLCREETDRAKERQAHGETAPGRTLPAARREASMKRNRHDGETAEHIARKTGASGRSVARVARVRRQRRALSLLLRWRHQRIGRMTPQEAERYLQLSPKAQARIAAEPDAEKRRTMAVESKVRSVAVKHGKHRNDPDTAMNKPEFSPVFLCQLERSLEVLEHQFGLRTADAIVAAFETHVHLSHEPTARQFERILPLIDAISTIASRRSAPTLSIVKTTTP